MDQPSASSALIVRVAGAICAIPLTEVVETMRPLPIEPLTNTPDFILGMARIRGAAVPVVLLSGLFQGDQCCNDSTRFVTLRVGQRSVALAVQGVIGVADLSEQVFGDLPPLLKTVRTELIQRLGTLDAEFLVMLDTARLVPESIWQALVQSRATR